MSFVQDISNAASVAAGTTIAATLTGVTAGNLIRCVVAYINSGVSRTITVSDGTSYTAANTAFFDGSNDQVGMQEFYLPNAGAGSHIVTATFSAGGTSSQFIYLQEVSNIATSGALNGATTITNTSVSSGANTIASNSLTTTGGGTCDLCAFTIDGNGTITVTAGTTLTWTIRNGNLWAPQTGICSMGSEDLAAQAAGSYTATFGFAAGSGRFYCSLVAYNNIAAVSGGPLFYNRKNVLYFIN